jgi:hypothetical protein
MFVNPPDSIKSTTYENLSFPFQQLCDTIMTNIASKTLLIQSVTKSNRILTL